MKKWVYMLLLAIACISINIYAFGLVTMFTFAGAEEDSLSVLCFTDHTVGKKGIKFLLHLIFNQRKTCAFH